MRPPRCTTTSRPRPRSPRWSSSRRRRAGGNRADGDRQRRGRRRAAAAHREVAAPLDGAAPARRRARGSRRASPSWRSSSCLFFPPGRYGPAGGVRPRELWALVLLFSGSASRATLRGGPSAPGTAIRSPVCWEGWCRSTSLTLGVLARQPRRAEGGAGAGGRCGRRLDCPVSPDAAGRFSPAPAVGRDTASALHGSVRGRSPRHAAQSPPAGRSFGPDARAGQPSPVEERRSR